MTPKYMKREEGNNDSLTWEEVLRVDNVLLCKNEGSPQEDLVAERLFPRSREVEDQSVRRVWLILSLL